MNQPIRTHVCGKKRNKWRVSPIDLNKHFRFDEHRRNPEEAKYLRKQFELINCPQYYFEKLERSKLRGSQADFSKFHKKSSPSRKVRSKANEKLSQNKTDVIKNAREKQTSRRTEGFKPRSKSRQTETFATNAPEKESKQRDRCRQIETACEKKSLRGKERLESNDDSHRIRTDVSNDRRKQSPPKKGRSKAGDKLGQMEMAVLNAREKESTSSMEKLRSKDNRDSYENEPENEEKSKINKANREVSGDIVNSQEVGLKEGEPREKLQKEIDVCNPEVDASSKNNERANLEGKNSNKPTNTKKKVASDEISTEQNEMVTAIAESDHLNEEDSDGQTVKKRDSSSKLSNQPEKKSNKCKSRSETYLSDTFLVIPSLNVRTYEKDLKDEQNEKVVAVKEQHFTNNSPENLKRQQPDKGINEKETASSKKSNRKSKSLSDTFIVIPSLNVRTEIKKSTGDEQIDGRGTRPWSGLEEQDRFNRMSDGFLALEISKQREQIVKASQIETELTRGRRFAKAEAGYSSEDSNWDNCFPELRDYLANSGKVERENDRNYEEIKVRSNQLANSDNGKNKSPKKLNTNGIKYKQIRTNVGTFGPVNVRNSLSTMNLTKAMDSSCKYEENEITYVPVGKITETKDINDGFYSSRIFGDDLEKESYSYYDVLKLLVRRDSNNLSRFEDRGGRGDADALILASSEKEDGTNIPQRYSNHGKDSVFTPARYSDNYYRISPQFISDPLASISNEKKWSENRESGFSRSLQNLGHRGIFSSPRASYSRRKKWRKILKSDLKVKRNTILKDEVSYLREFSTQNVHILEETHWSLNGFPKSKLTDGKNYCHDSFGFIQEGTRFNEDNGNENDDNLVEEFNEEVEYVEGGNPCEVNDENESSRQSTSSLFSVTNSRKSESPSADVISPVNIPRSNRDESSDNERSRTHSDYSEQSRGYDKFSEYKQNFIESEKKLERGESRKSFDSVKTSQAKITGTNSNSECTNTIYGTADSKTDNESFGVGCNSEVEKAKTEEKFVEEGTSRENRLNTRPDFSKNRIGQYGDKSHRGTFGTNRCFSADKRSDDLATKIQPHFRETKNERFDKKDIVRVVVGNDLPVFKKSKKEPFRQNHRQEKNLAANIQETRKERFSDENHYRRFSEDNDRRNFPVVKKERSRDEKPRDTYGWSDFRKAKNDSSWMKNHRNDQTVAFPDSSKIKSYRVPAKNHRATPIDDLPRNHRKTKNKGAIEKDRGELIGEHICKHGYSSRTYGRQKNGLHPLAIHRKPRERVNFPKSSKSSPKKLVFPEARHTRTSKLRMLFNLSRIIAIEALEKKKRKMLNR